LDVLKPGCPGRLGAGASPPRTSEEPGERALAGRSDSSRTWTDKVQNLSVKTPHLFGFYNRKRCPKESIFIIIYSKL
jgi:hypothetical protein